MSNRNPHWYDANESRDYPLDERATCLSDRGERLSQAILADLRISYPQALGGYPFVSAVSVTPYAVSVLLQAASTLDNIEQVFTPLAGVTVVRSSLQPGRGYLLKALAPGVSGTVVFGEGATQLFTGTFRTPQQGLLAPRAAKLRRGLPVTSLRKLYQGQPLTGVVRLLGEDPVAVVKESRDIDGVNRDVIVIKLQEAAQGSNLIATESVFARFAGPCAGRPESQSCGNPQPIEFINSTGPDCNGVLEIELLGCAVVGQNSDDGALIVDCGFGLAEACLPPYLPDAEGVLPTEKTPINIVPPAPLPPEPAPSDSLSNHVIVLGELPYECTFDTYTADYFHVESGEFTFVDDDSPYETSASVSRPYPAVSYATEGLASAARINLSVWQGFDVTTLYRQVTTDFKMQQGPAGARHNGGIVINYHPNPQDTATVLYHLALVDYDTQSLRILRFNGTLFQETIAVNVPGLRLDRWYRLQVRVAPHDSHSVGITVILRDLVDDNFSTILGPLLVNLYLPDNGYFGLGSNRAFARFSYFRLDEWVP